MAQRVERKAGGAGRAHARPDNQGSAPLPFDYPNRWFEFLANKGGVGKSLSSNRFRDYLLRNGVPVRMIRIDSSTVLDGTAGSDDVEIATDNFPDAAQKKGGLASFFTPAEKALVDIKERGGVAIVDWGAGLVEARLRMLVAAGFDAFLDQIGVVGTTVLITTADASVMRQAHTIRTQDLEFLPGLRHAVVLNEYAGSFDFAERSEQKKAFQRLLEGLDPEQVLRLPLVQGRALEIFDEAGVSLETVLHTEPAVLPSLVPNEPRVVVIASQNYVDAFWNVILEEYEKLSRFRGLGIGQAGEPG